MKTIITSLIILAYLQFITTGCSKADKKEVDLITSGFIYENAPFAQCHASTVVETDDGILAAWFGGTKEQNPDVCIYTSKMIGGNWEPLKLVADGIINDTLRYSCWNPVLFRLPNDTILLFYKIGPSAQEWWGAIKTSGDNGETWSDSKLLPEGFLGPIKNKPVMVEGQRLICPSSTESTLDDGWRVHFEISDDFGKTWKKVDLDNGKENFNIIQPSILIHDDGRLQMLARSKEDCIVTSWSSDHGDTWSAPQATELPNPNSGIDAVTLKCGLQLVVYNPTHKAEGKWGGKRTPLSVAVSRDGLKWEPAFTLEDTPGEYSYPAVIQGSDGTIHVTYTYKRRKVKHVELKVD